MKVAADRAEFLGVYAGNLSALDVLTEISKRVPADLDVVFEELAIDKQMIRMRVQAKSFEAADRLGQELAKFPPFAQARIGAIETDNKTGAKRFDVTISLAASSAADGFVARNTKAPTSLLPSPAITTSRTSGAKCSMKLARSGPTFTQVPVESLKSSAMRPRNSSPRAGSSFSRAQVSPSR